jgi:Ni/Fe-hydrogenase 1 B-type cytochrome subunit
VKRKLPSAADDPDPRQRIALWLKVVHWLHLAAMVLLILTGFQISYARGFFIFPTMRLARTWHFYAMWLLFWTLVARTYYLLATGEFRDYVLTKRDLADLPRLGRFYLFIDKEPPLFGKYNPGQKAMYGVFPWVLALQALTGFVLYNPTHYEALWLHNWLWNLNTIRTIHFYIAWFFVVAVSAHLYLVLVEAWDGLREMVTFRPRPARRERRR